MRLGLHRRIHIFPTKRQQAITRYLVLILAVLICLYFCALFLFRAQPVFLSRAGSYANNLAVKIINESINDVFSEQNILYNDLVTLVTDESGKVTSIQSNVTKINSLKSNITTSIQANFDKSEIGTVKIPFGSIFENALFSGMGPRLSVRVAPINTIRVDFKNEFISTGINQVKHQIYLNISVTISLISATMEKTETVDNNILVAETVIVGTVPNYYANNAPINAVVD